MSDAPIFAYRFDPFELDPRAYRLRRQGRPMRLERRPMDLLVLLVERRGELVTRGEIAAHLWQPDVFVDVEAAVNTLVWKLRSALHDSPDSPRFIETISGKGYRFVAPVEVVSAVERPPSAADAACRAAEALSAPSNASPAPAPTSPATETVGAAKEAPSRRSGGQERTAEPRRGLAAWLVPAGGLVIALTGLVWLGGNSPPAPVRLAVLPFEDLGVEQGSAYLAEGLAEDTIVSLGMIDPVRLIVTGRTSTLRYQGTTKTLEEIGAELGVDYLVESTVRTEGQRLRLTAKLIRVRDHALIWSQLYERELTSTLGLQIEISTAIAEQVRVGISRDAIASIEHRHTRHVGAYDLYIHGRTLWNERKPATTQRALEYYRRAIALDPEYALAWSGIADANAAGPINGDAEPVVSQQLAREAMSQAVRAGADLSEVQTSLGTLNFWLEWNWPQAEQGLRRAVALNAGNAQAHLVLANVLSHSRRHGAAAEQMRLAREVDLLDPMMHAISSQLAFHAHDYPAAAQHARQAILVAPDFWIGHMALGQALAQVGQTDLALQSLVEAERLSGGNSKPVSTRGYVLGKAGRTREARVILDELVHRSRQRYVPQYAVALVHAGLGDRESAMTALDVAYVEHDVHLAFLTVDPKWDPYRTDARFEQLLARCGFLVIDDK